MCHRFESIPENCARSVANAPELEKTNRRPHALALQTAKVSLDILDARTRVLALMGDPVSHSVSPRAQSFALSRRGLNALCLAFEVAPEKLIAAVRGARTLGMSGVMVTIPHKEAVLSCCNDLHPSAQLVGAANFLEFRADGTICGHASDGWAALRSLRDRDISVRGKRIAILGGGGSARTLALTFADAGAASVALYNRTVERAQRIADEVQDRLHITSFAHTLPVYDLKEVDIVVNTTSIGMTPDTKSSPLEASAIEPHHTVFDIVYNPLETRLLREARGRGAQIVNGLDMVLWTNVYAAKIAFDVDLDIEDLRDSAWRALGN